jgi:hypothetical protein
LLWLKRDEIEATTRRGVRGRSDPSPREADHPKAITGMRLAKFGLKRIRRSQIPLQVSADLVGTRAPPAIKPPRQDRIAVPR